MPRPVSDEALSENMVPYYINTVIAVLGSRALEFVLMPERRIRGIVMFLSLFFWCLHRAIHG